MTCGSSEPLVTVGDRCCPCGTVAAPTQRGPSTKIYRRCPLRIGVGWGTARCPEGLPAEDALSTMGSWTGPWDAEVTWHGAEETSKPETLAVQGSQGDRRRRATGGWAGGAHRERASEGHWARWFRHRRLGPQHRPRRWARRPQHPGDDQKQDRAGGVKRSGGRGPPDA